jgi:hypothetical protein
MPKSLVLRVGHARCSSLQGALRRDFACGSRRCPTAGPNEKRKIIDAWGHVSVPRFLLSPAQSEGMKPLLIAGILVTGQGGYPERERPLPCHPHPAIPECDKSRSSCPHSTPALRAGPHGPGQGARTANLPRRSGRAASRVKPAENPSRRCVARSHPLAL